MWKFSLWCLAAEDTYVKAFKCEQIGAPNMTETLTHLKNCLWPRFRWIKERPWLDKVVKEMLCGLRPQQLSSSDWYHHCANRTNALGSLFPIINRSNIYTLIHHREKKNKIKIDKMKQFSEGGRCYWKISSIHHFSFSTLYSFMMD